MYVPTPFLVIKTVLLITKIAEVLKNFVIMDLEDSSAHATHIFLGKVCLSILRKY